MTSTAQPRDLPRPVAAGRPAASGLRLCLRSVTAAAHKSLDSKLSALDLTTLPGYRRFLEINATAVLPLEIPTLTRSTSSRTNLAR